MVSRVGGAGCSSSFGGAPRGARRSGGPRRPWPKGYVPLLLPFCDLGPDGVELGPSSNVNVEAGHFTSRTPRQLLIRIGILTRSLTLQATPQPCDSLSSARFAASLRPLSSPFTGPSKVHPNHRRVLLAHARVPSCPGAATPTRRSRTTT